MSEILADKTGDLLTIDADDSVLDAVRKMVEANVGSLLVNVDGNVEGIVTDLEAAAPAPDGDAD